MNPEISATYGKRLRIRVCGLCFNDDALLMINHSLYAHDFWAPPGGGMEYGEHASETLKREFREESGLSISVNEFLFVCEFLNPPLHAIELFFRVENEGGKVSRGLDPETSTRMIKEIRWMTAAEVWALPSAHLHGIFRVCADFNELLKLRGYHKI